MDGHDFLYGLLAGFALGGAGGLWLGFKLWRETFVKIAPLPGRGWLK